MRKAIGKLIVMLVCVAMSAPAQHERLLNYSIVGSASSGHSPSFGKAMESPEVQRLLLELSSGPREVTYADSVLHGAGVSRSDLEDLKLIKRSHGRCSLNFTLFTAADVRKVREVSERYAPSLAADFLAKRQEIENALRTYSAPGVDIKAVAFIVVGCFSLDWDGLTICAEQDYRLTESKRPDGRYVPYAEERSGMSREKIYWGSSNDQYDDVRLTSFGDHYSLPREAFPDFLWSLDGSTPDAGLPGILKSSTPGKKKDKFTAAANQLGNVLFALRDSGRTVRDIAQIASLSEGEVTSWLALLSGMEYVIETNSVYRLSIPVFDERDKEMIGQVRKIGRGVIASWLKAHYDDLKKDLSGTSPMLNGVPYEEGFTMIWHFIFGIANRELVSAGMFADPYAATRKHKGFIPAVYSSNAM